MLRLTVFPAYIFTDHLNIIIGIANGRHHTTDGKHANADLSKVFWHRLDDLGGLSTMLTINWIPSHQTGNSLEAIGNRWADTLAKMGAAVHEVLEEDLERVKALREKQCSVIKIEL